MSKYKIGDRVKYEGGEYAMPDVGTVVRFIRDEIWTKWDSDGKELYFKEGDQTVSLLQESEQNKDVQIIDGIEYPYVTVEGDEPVRIICDNLKHDYFTVVVATLIDGIETTDTLTFDFKDYVGNDTSYIKPYVKPKSIFEGTKHGTVVFARELTQEDDWFPVLFKEETSHFVQDIANRILPKTEYEFRLDNPYLED